jgi:nitrite reductase/ring-hydroxylating ferredoxin subunit
MGFGQAYQNGRSPHEFLPVSIDIIVQTERKNAKCPAHGWQYHPLVG